LGTLTWILGSSLAMSAIALVGVVSVALTADQQEAAPAARGVLGGFAAGRRAPAPSAGSRGRERPGLGTFLPSLGGFALFFLMEQFLS
jgi:hypothetical protein